MLNKNKQIKMNQYLAFDKKELLSLILGCIWRQTSTEAIFNCLDKLADINPDTIVTPKFPLTIYDATSLLCKVFGHKELSLCVNSLADIFAKEEENNSVLRLKKEPLNNLIPKFDEESKSSFNMHILHNANIHFPKNNQNKDDISDSQKEDEDEDEDDDDESEEGKKKSNKMCGNKRKRESESEKSNFFLQSNANSSLKNDSKEDEKCNKKRKSKLYRF